MMWRKMELVYELMLQVRAARLSSPSTGIPPTPLRRMQASGSVMCHDGQCSAASSMPLVYCLAPCECIVHKNVTVAA